MNLVSWNINHRRTNWNVLAGLMEKHDATAAMIQEAVAPPPDIGLQVHGDPSLGDDPWRIPIPPGARREFASGVALLDGVAAKPWESKPLANAEYGMPVISHPGQWVAVAIGKPPDIVWVVSLYGVWDTVNTKDIFAEATLHRALSDLAFLFHARDTKRIVLAGDLNVWRGYGQGKWKAGYDNVFERLRAYGLELIGPFRKEGSPLEKCPCGGGDACSHVQTYRHQRKKDSTPYQTDFVFARGVKAQCYALDDESVWEVSDHCPILIDVADA